MDGISNSQLPIMLSPADWQGLNQMKHLSDADKLAITSTEFESTLLRQFLNEAMKPLVKGALDESGVAHEIYRGLFTDSIAQSLAQGGGLGISNVLQSQLTQQPQPNKTDAA